jgi:hypothetical protein
MIPAYHSVRPLLDGRRPDDAHASRVLKDAAVSRRQYMACCPISASLTYSEYCGIFISWPSLSADSWATMPLTVMAND